MTKVSVEEIASLVGTDLGVSDWMAIDQDRVDGFADVTIDHQYIHVDPGRAAHTPFGGTIAHGFLTLSLLVHLAEGLMPEVEGTVMGINYGFEKVRFVTPVRVGSRIRLGAKVKAVASKGPGRHLITYDVAVEIEGEDKPALVAEWLAMVVTAE